MLTGRSAGWAGIARGAGDDIPIRKEIIRAGLDIAAARLRRFTDENTAVSPAVSGSDDCEDLAQSLICAALKNGPAEAVRRGSL
jgi:hypothetical protein